MTWTMHEHEEEHWELYRAIPVRDLDAVISEDASMPERYCIREQLVVEDHSDFAWVWEEEQ